MPLWVFVLEINLASSCYVIRMLLSKWYLNLQLIS